MPSIVPRIDHPVIAVADMDAARAAYERLGFTVPPRGSHIEWGTGNSCIMFEKDYLELRGIIDASRYTHRLDKFLATHGEGFMGLAFATDDAEHTYRALTECGLQPQPVRSLARNFELAEGNVQLRFALCFIDAVDAPGLMSVVFCQHLTPQWLRRPEWLIHANGAIGVMAVTGIVADIDAAESFHRRLFSSDAVRREDDLLRIRFPSQQTIELMTPARLRDSRPHLGVYLSEAGDRLVSVTLRTSDIETTEALLASRQIRCGHNSHGLWIDPEEACGAVLEISR